MTDQRSTDPVASESRRYLRLGAVAKEPFEVVGAGPRFREVWACEVCGAVVYRRGTHDQWHILIGNHPLTAVVSKKPGQDAR